MTDFEEWRAVPGYEGLYEVSNRGRCRSVTREVAWSNGHARILRGKVLKPQQMSARTEHLQVWLYRDRVGTKRRIHRLVLEAFVGPSPEGYMGCHNDGDATNNSLDNLRWDTPSSNSRDVVRHGHHPRANQTHCKRGHPYDAENTYIPKRIPPRTPERVCRICRLENQRRNKQRKRAERSGILAGGE